ncbi:MAG: undecaprenyl-diphosphate phosphatase [Fusobacterium sp.]|nr:undecaprenyl-diphosphate phosphatase [Fusobacterium sp.]
MTPLLFVIILSIVEGITEFLPVSSTGHMILVEQFIGKDIFSKAFMNNFLVIVQLGAILAVVIYFWKDISPFVKTKEEFTQKFRLWLKIIVGVLPAAIIGLLLDDIIEEYFLDNVLVIAITLIFYGLILIVVEKQNKVKNNIAPINTFAKLKYKTAFFIGFFQCLAMIPGTSRSGATIIGSLLLGLSRSLAAEFSFYLAIPTMFGATLLKVLKSGLNFSSEELIYLALGTFLSFVVAYISIKWLMNFLKRKDFVFFGIYRITIGIIILISILF